MFYKKRQNSNLRDVFCFKRKSDKSYHANNFRWRNDIEIHDLHYAPLDFRFNEICSFLKSKYLKNIIHLILWYPRTQNMQIQDAFTIFKQNKLIALHTFPVFFSFVNSPQPKAQVSFSDQNLSVVRRHRRHRRCLCRCCWHKHFTFSSSSPESLGQFQPNLAQSNLGWRGFKFVQMKGPTLFHGEIITKYRKYIDTFLKFSSPEQLRKF